MRSWVLEPVASSRTAYCVLRCCTVDSCGAPGMELFLAALLNAWPPAFAGVPTVPPDVHVHICVAKTRLPLITRHRDLGALHVVVIDQRPCLRTTDTLPPSVNQVIEPRDMAGPESTAVWMNCYTSTATWIKCHHQHHGWGGSSGVGVGDGSDSQHQPGYTWGIDANQTAWMQAMRGPSIPGVYGRTQGSAGINGGRLSRSAQDQSTAGRADGSLHRVSVTLYAVSCIAQMYREVPECWNLLLFVEDPGDAVTMLCALLLNHGDYLDPHSTHPKIRLVLCWGGGGATQHQMDVTELAKQLTYRWLPGTTLVSRTALAGTLLALLVPHVMSDGSEISATIAEQSSIAWLSQLFWSGPDTAETLRYLHLAGGEDVPPCLAFFHADGGPWPIRTLWPRPFWLCHGAWTTLLGQVYGGGGDVGSEIYRLEAQVHWMLNGHRLRPQAVARLLAQPGIRAGGGGGATLVAPDVDLITINGYQLDGGGGSPKRRRAPDGPPVQLCWIRSPVRAVQHLRGRPEPMVIMSQPPHVMVYFKGGGGGGGVG